MITRSWVRKLFTHTPRTFRKTAAWCQLSLEALEDRALPSVLFYPAVISAVGSFPDSVAVGDFNGDGKQDLAVANAGSNTVNVELGNGDGTFQSGGAYGTGSPPYSVAVGDFNGDGKLDLATANNFSNSVSVLLGNGNGTFQSAVSYSVGNGPASVAVGDFNGDGKPDLAVANTGNNTVSVLLSNGNGTFQSAVSYGVGSAPKSVAVGDFNRDGKQDLAVVNTRTNFLGVLGNSVSVLLGNGNGTFSSGASYAAGSGLGTTVASVAVGDFNGDGNQDLAVASFDNNAVEVLKGNGDGTFGNGFLISGGTGPSSVAVGDFDRDGKQDLVVADQSINSVSVLLGNGVSFDPAGSFFVNGSTPLSVAVGDFNGDGVPDIATADYLSNRVSVLLTDTPPTIASNRATVTANEGAPATNGGAFNDLQGRSTVTLIASLGTVTQNNTTGAWSWSYIPPDGPASTTVTITATDNLGFTTSTTFTLNTLNVPPSITSFTVPSSGAEGSAVNLSATATDPGVLDTLTYTWTVTRPDGSTFATLTGAQASFTPPDNGTYGGTLTVTDKDGGTAVARTAPAGLISWWRGEGNATDALGVNNGTLGSGVTFAAGEVGQAFNLSGSNQVTVADAPSLDLTTAVTLEAWIKPSTLAFNNNFGAVIAKGSSTARNYGLFVKSNGALHLSYFTTGGTNIFLETASNLVPVGRFSHVAAVIDTSAGVMQLYVNGKLVASRATGGSLVANSVPLTIGLSDPGFNYGFKGLIDEPSIYGRALSQGEIQAIVNAGSTGKISPVAVANVAPTPTFSGFGTGLATQILTYNATATDPSPIDQAAGFAYSINWGDGSPIQTVPTAAGDGSGVSISHVFTSAGTYTVTLSATDKDNGTGSVSSTVTVLDVTSANLQTVINQQGSISFQDNTDAQAQSVVTAVNGLAAQTTPVTITMNLGNANYTDLNPSPKAGITLVISGSGGATTIVGHSPVLKVTGGNVVVSNVTLVTDTDSPTLQVSGGNLTLRNVVIEESIAASQAALLITGGTVDLGTASNPGGNRFDAHGAGELIHNAGAGTVSAIGNTFQVDGTTLTSPYRIEDKIFHALDNGGGGLVSYVAGNVYVTPSSGSIQRGVDVIAAGDTVNVEAGSYAPYAAGAKLLTVSFENGPVLTQQADALDPSVRTLVVTGTPGNDKILFNLGGTGGAVQALVNAVTPGTFSPTGRLIAHGGAGDDDIQVAGSITLPAWLYGDAGNDRLKGGGGNNVLLGGAGDDQLIGGPAHDLLIGGIGADTLNAGARDGLMIAGTTAFDDNEAALASVMAEWTSTRDYATRVANLRGTGTGQRANGDVFLKVSGPDATEFDDGAVDVLLGGSGMDWFFAALSQDIIHGRHDGEFVDSL